MKYKILLILFVFFLVFLADCSNPPVENTTPVVENTTPVVEACTGLSGNLVYPPDSINGKPYKIILMSDFSTITVEAEGTLGNNTTEAYCISSVNFGSYYLFVYVDNDNSGFDKSLGDFSGIYGSIVNPSPNLNYTDNTLRFDVNLYLLNVGGTITIPAPADGKLFCYSVDTDSVLTNGEVATGCFDLGSNATFKFAVFRNVAPGTYFIRGFVDVDGDGFLEESGEYRGFYGASFPFYYSPPASANAVVPASGTISFDFNLGIIP